MKKLVTLTALLLAVCLSVPILASCANHSSDATSTTYISLRINPEIELIANESGEVLAANAVNEDGDTVLTQVDLVGMTVEEAGAAFTNIATELGYVDPDSTENIVYVDVEANSEEASERLEKSLAEKINRYFENKGIYGKVSPDTLDRYADRINDWNVSPGHAKMILRVLDLYPEMSEEEVLSLSVSDRLALLKDYKKNNGLTVEVREKYADAVKALRTEYEDLFTMKARMEELEVSLADTTLTEEEKGEITAEYEALKAQYDELFLEYKEKLDTLKTSHKNTVKDSLDKVKEKAAKKRSDNSEKLEKHAEKVSKDKNNITESIRKWRDAA